ncbi:helicase [Clostridium botulinum]|uniref:helicase n=1 Tax=Clostridium botulinum TaxID=1491 RepID=UPI001E59F3D4|nr:helicase [Clostridium botulinum]MCD3275579.1 helicase [Clostridium botulinum C/D]MCD3286503.1 helicase [Clostridium botulinum C/D]MCD3291472.1 helicase [Clostridium botulinum C/D]MCD3303822.1 helicase [Clostridium botulinum C/D]
MGRDTNEQNKLKDDEIKALLQIKEFKKNCEANIVSILWKQPDLYYTYDSLALESFTHNEWRVFWQIGYDIVIKENKPNLDEVTIGMYLEKHHSLREKYEEYGGFEKIQLATEYIKVENINGYISELNKWNTVIMLAKAKFPISNRLKEFVDLSAEDIYDEYEALLNHIFINVEGDDCTYDIADGIDELIDELDQGLAVGLPLYNSDMLNKEIGGNLVGNITLCGGLSGVGKTTFSRNILLPSMIEHDEKLVIMINEEGKKKWQRELLIWVANNVYKTDVQKYKLRNGKYSSEFKTFLKEKCAKWIKDHRKNILLKPFSKYTTSKAVKCIKKYAHMGVRYFMLDTFKADANGNISDTMWLGMQQAMVNIYDTIKEESLNVHIWITFQLSKSSSKQRYYTMDNIGMAKNMIDVASTCLMIRNLFDDEYDGEKHKLNVYKLAGKNGKTKIPVKLDKSKHYQIIFIIKNREGSSNDYQIVVEHDLSRNTYNEVGITVVPTDW